MTDALKAIEAVEAGDWEAAHALVQDDRSPEAAWVHAHLHRMDGDLDNARYWYARAGKKEARGSLKAERQELRRALAGTD